VTALPHAREFLEFCRVRSLQTFLLSSVHARHYALQASALGFDAFITHPYPEVHDKTTRIHDLIRIHHLDPKQTLFIGDMHDIEAARQGGSGPVPCSPATTTPANRAPRRRICVAPGELHTLLEPDCLEFQAAADSACL
jgi:hypothetical protein